MSEDSQRISQDEINGILWKACDTFRGTIDPSEYKNYILVMLFLKYISDVWRERFEELRQRYGDDEPTNMCLEASYFQVNVFAKTLEKTNSMETNLMRDSVMGSEFDAPQGGVSINPVWGHADLWTRIGRANRQGQFDIVYESPTCVKADPYLIGYGRCLEYS